MRITQTLEYYIRTTYLCLTRIYNIVLRDIGLTQTEALILISIKRDGTPITKLTSYLGMQNSSLNRPLKRLEELGLIKRHQDEFDKRIFKVFLTSKGLQYRRKVKQLAENFNKQFLSTLTEEERKTFFQLFDKIRDNIRIAQAQILKTKDYEKN